MDDHTPHLLGVDNSQTPHLLGGDIVDRLTTLFWAMKDAGRPLDKNTVADAIAEIERLQGWQATAAGLSQDISNAEDEIERLQVQVRGQAFELMIAHSEAAGLYGITMDDQHTPDETCFIKQQHSDYVQGDQHE